MRVKIRITGIVQGVGFRPFTYHTAKKNHLAGHVKNTGDAGVEIFLEGEENDIKNFQKDLEEKKPPLAQIHEVVTTLLDGENQYKGFTICKSSEEGGLSGSIIPPDVAMCNECLNELGDPPDRRHDYFFVTCTNCGPRYSIIKSLPYDRDNTTMRNFRMCSFCEGEYANPLNRRFHAQTVACPKCGPKAYLTTRTGEMMKSADPIREAGRLLSEGFIVAVKGYGGFHIAATAILDEPLIRLRTVKHRSQKPFAVMARSLDASQIFAETSPKEKELLASYTRPIVLLNKREDYYLSDLVAPGLHNIGVMLPYTGLHHLLFDAVAEPAFVMTSANPPNQPIVTDNDEALRKLGGTVDYFLFHDRQVAHRCDDSVVRLHGDQKVFIRRSRGYAPAPIILKEKASHHAVGLGGEENNTACVFLDKKAFISQHIGDVENIETRDFLKNATKHLIRLTSSKVERIACDLHPKFVTTQMAHELAEENSWQLIQVQHHHAHMAALMAEHGIDKIAGICCDGYGYGEDGEAWGGEILLCTSDSPSYKRLAHLQKQPLIGGDLATRYPLRVVAGILHDKVNMEEWLLLNKRYFPHGELEIETILSIIEGGRSTKTTSCGRVLDAVAAVLGICYERTYKGEPAMKLESVALSGKDVLGLEPTVENNTLTTTRMLLRIFENRERFNEADLAYSAHTYLAKGLAKLAVEKALANDVRTVGFSGGVACNQIMASEIRRIVESCGLRFVVHKEIPPGDGGLSLGQAVVAGSFQS